MRRELLWALAASALLSGWALLNPGPKTRSGGVVAPADRTASLSGIELAGSSPSASSLKPVNPYWRHSPEQLAVTALPSTWPSPNMEPAARSPFVPPAPPAPKAASALPVAAPPPPPPPPAVTYRFWASLATPTGERVLYVARDDNAQPIAVQVGTRLDGGFQVEQITAGAIVLIQAESQRHVTLSLSPPPSIGVQ